MKRLNKLKNKYVIASILFVIYIFFLDDVDIFKIVHQNNKLDKIQQEKASVLKKYEETKEIVYELRNTRALERYAREEKLFKRDDEDVYVIVTE
jgi:pyoverdine/dityrosine biosynthesis protein Dit1